MLQCSVFIEPETNERNVDSTNDHFGCCSLFCCCYVLRYAERCSSFLVIAINKVDKIETPLQSELYTLNEIKVLAVVIWKSDVSDNWIILNAAYFWIPGKHRTALVKYKVRRSQVLTHNCACTNVSLWTWLPRGGRRGIVGGVSAIIKHHSGPFFF